MIKPIGPDEAVEFKHSRIPDFVIEAWNGVIADNLQGRESGFSQSTLVGAIVAAAARSGTPTTADEVFRHGWMDLEPLYRAQGWKVVYDKPGFNETYAASFTFTAPRTG